MTQPFLIVCLLFFGGISTVAVNDLFEGDTFERIMAAFFLIMTAWAAGLLLQPPQNF